MKLIQSVLSSLLFPKKHLRIIIGIILAIMVPLVYLIVYFTGGIKYVYSHTMYIPIVLIGVIFGLKWGVLAALIGALLLGPLMPIDTALGEQQEAINWIYRSIIFISIGAFSGFFSDVLRNREKRIVFLLSRNQESGILLYNSIPEDKLYEDYLYPVIIIRVLNQIHVSDQLGIKTYYELWQTISNEIEKTKSLKGQLYQIDNLLFAYLAETNNVEEVIQNLSSILDVSHQLNKVSIYLETVIGYTKQIDTLQNKINNAMVASRYAEINHLKVLQYKPSFSKNDISIQLLAGMKQALKNEELFMQYQTMVDAKTKKTCGFEALIRWNHPTFGYLPPLDFIPVIEQSQLIHDMTIFVCRKVKEEILPYAVKNDLFVSINLTTKNIFNKSLMNKLLSEECFTQAERNHLIFELTESTFITNPEEAVNVMLRIKNHGIQIALDDFGTGYSSLSYLGKYPLDIIKIDKSFIQQFSDKNNRVIVESAILLTKNLKYKVVVEGIESEYLANEITNLKCDILQGFYYSKPKNIEDLFLDESENKKE